MHFSTRARAWVRRHPRLQRMYQRYKIRTLTSGVRVLPDFVLIGVQKGGTTSLYDFITRHPRIARAARKEIHYFTDYHRFGPAWYKSSFPTRWTVRPGMVTGEADTMYMFHREVPGRMRRLLPDVKLIAILRNPVDRAYSHWQMNAHTGELIPSKLTFEEALALEKEVWSGHDGVRMSTGAKANIWERQVNSYLARGMYADQLEYWFRHYPRERFLVLSTEDLRREPGQVLDKVFDFLGVQSYHTGNLPDLNVGRYRQEMAPETRKRLVRHFRPHNARLYKLLQRDFDWDG